MNSSVARHRTVGHSFAVVPEIAETTVGKDEAVTSTDIARRAEPRRAAHYAILGAVAHNQ